MSTQSCPGWIKSMLESMLAEHETWPGIQLTVTSPYCDLEFTTSVQSTAERFAKEPALLDDTPWRLASITKTFTAVAILKLSQQDKLDVFAPAVKYLPDWAVSQIKQSQGEAHAEITIWQLLHHTSGLGDFASDPRFMEIILNEPQHEWTSRSVIEWSTNNSKSVGSPGGKYRYSDTGYTLLGVILETVTKSNLAAAVRDLCQLKELNMSSTHWELLEPGESKRAGQYHEDIDVTHFNPTFDLYGAGGLVGNSHDLNKFGRALYEGRLLDQRHMQLLYIVEASGFYASGVVRYSFAGQEAWGHTGYWKTWLYWVPSLDLVISGASNQAAGDGFDVERLVKGIIENGSPPLEAPRKAMSLGEWKTRQARRTL